MQDPDNQEIFIFIIIGSSVLTDLPVHHVGEFNISPLMFNVNITNTKLCPVLSRILQLLRINDFHPQES